MFTSTVPVNGNGDYNSGPFTPTVVGTYRCVAAYSGDVNNVAVASPYNAPNESSLITPRPTILVVKDVTPASLTEPGGTFTFSVVVTNTSNEVLTIRSLTDDIYGDLTTRADSTCTNALGTVMQPGQSYTCDFRGEFRGNGGDAQTDIVTVTATNPEGREVTASAKATVTLTPVGILARTGATLARSLGLALALVLAGALLVGAVRRRRPTAGWPSQIVPTVQ